MEKKGNKTFLIFVLAVALIFPLVTSLNIGISPAVINFEEVMRSGYAEKMLTISTDSEEDLRMEIVPRGDIATWLNFSEWNFSVSKQVPKYILASINPPIDTPNGNYQGFIRVTTSAVGENIEGEAVGKIVSSLDLWVNVTITDIEIIDCTVSNVEVISVEKGDDVILRMNILNNGNVRLRPKVLFNIWDFNQVSVLDNFEFFSKEILPTTEERVEFRVKSGVLDLGQYWSDLSVVECLYDSVLTFDILEEGALKSKGVLLSILTLKKVKIKETIPIEVNFKNIGEKEISAQFKGKISREGKVVQILESEESLVGINEIEQFQFYFTPEKSGKYVISGRVYYSGKKTFESSTAFDVEGGIDWVQLVSIVLVFVVLTLIYKIRKERLRFKMKLKHLK